MKHIFYLLVFLVLSPCVHAQEVRLLVPRYLSIGLEKYKVLRDPYTPEDNGRWTYGTHLGGGFSFLETSKFSLFLDSKIHFRSTSSQVRHGGLFFEAGTESLLARDLLIRAGHRHHSQHVLERNRESREYPLLDSYFMDVRWNLR